ncbi:MAG TPA: L-threonine 3-dehydrogenase [Chloroflexota bacterium]|nr:L-threonine 3-dehydrogenase [Chloroflexota bacterium]
MVSGEGTSGRDGAALVDRHVAAHTDRKLPPTMTALVKPEPRAGAELREVPVPSVGPRDVLIEVLASSICGTDLHIYSWDPWAEGRVHTPIVFGHEFAGRVVATGADVTRVPLGAYVAAESHIACGNCYECRHGMQHVCRNVQIVGVDRPGAFAEYIAIPEGNAWLTSERFPPEIATIQEPMGNAVHTALSVPLAGANVAIFGAGPIGLFAVPIARASGAARIIVVEPSSYRRQLAERTGADVVIDPASENVVRRIREETGGEGADVVLEMSGNGNAIAQAMESLRFGGNISLLGIPARPVELDLADGVIFKGATVRGISGRRLWETWYQTRGFLESGMDLSPIVTHRLPLPEFETAFELVRSGQSGKVVMYPRGADRESEVGI